jgi:hypothetical protein
MAAIANAARPKRARASRLPGPPLTFADSPPMVDSLTQLSERRLCERQVAKRGDVSEGDINLLVPGTARRLANFQAHRCSYQP